MVVFWGVFFIFAGWLGAYISWRLLGPVLRGRLWKIALSGAIVGVLLITPLTIVLRRSGMENPGVNLAAWGGYVGLGFLTYVFTLLIFRDLLWLAARLCTGLGRLLRNRKNLAASKENPDNPERRLFLLRSVNYGIVGSASLFTGHGFQEARRLPRVEEVTVFLENLPEDLEGFRIVQITDIHVSPTIRRDFVEQVALVVNGLKADMIALTGDLVDGSVEALSYHVAPLAALESVHGNFFVTGNHEYYSGAAAWVEKIGSMGFDVLLNEHRLLTRGKGRLLVAGVTDYRAGAMVPGHRSDTKKALKQAPPADAKILLAHQPKSIFDASEAGFDLQISGHTHGGQFFPWNFVVALDQPFLSGLHRVKGTQIYVSRGTGYWGPPMRVGFPSEITVIRLVSGRAPAATGLPKSASENSLPLLRPLTPFVSSRAL